MSNLQGFTIQIYIKIPNYKPVGIKKSHFFRGKVQNYVDIRKFLNSYFVATQKVNIFLRFDYINAFALTGRDTHDEMRLSQSPRVLPWAMRFCPFR